MSGGQTSGDTTSVLKGGGPDVARDVGHFNLGDEKMKQIRSSAAAPTWMPSSN